MIASVFFVLLNVYFRMTHSSRGGRYYRKKLSTADISEFFKLSANYRYRILGIWELSKNYRYRKLHPILSDKHNWKHCSKNRLTEKQHKSCWWFRRRWEYCGIFCFWLDWGLAKWWRGGGGHHSKSADKILRQRCEIIKITKFSWTTTCHVVSMH